MEVYRRLHVMQIDFQIFDKNVLSYPMCYNLEVTQFLPKKNNVHVKRFLLCDLGHSSVHYGNQNYVVMQFFNKTSSQFIAPSQKRRPSILVVSCIINDIVFKHFNTLKSHIVYVDLVFFQVGTISH